jgi:hypothetical protein
MLPGKSSSTSTNAADKPPAVDITLEEAKRILADYISLLPGQSTGVTKETAAVSAASSRN